MIVRFKSQHNLARGTKTDIILLLLLIIFLCVFSGCTTFSTMTKATHDVTADLDSSGKHLKKTIGIATFGYRTFPLDFSLEDAFQKMLVDETASECPNLLLITSSSPSLPNVLRYPPRYASGKIDNFTLAKKARNAGLNAIVIGSPVDVNESFEEKGLLWFKDTHSFVRVQIEVNAYDTSTGAKLLDENVIYKIEMNPEDMEKIRKKNYESNPGLNEAMIRMAKKISEKLCEEVTIQPWKSYITSVSENRVSLSSGSKVGLKPGDVLEIRESEDIIAGANNQRFYIPGDKIGEIELTLVNPDRSDGRITTSAKDISVGDIVQYKD